MIPRLKPYFDHRELVSALSYSRHSVAQFEREFCGAADARFALAFPYARSAIYAILQSKGLHDAEVLLPAYTCVVVPNSVVRSGNTPRFVDVSLQDYNMDLDELNRKITRNTKAVIATHLYGYPLDVERLHDCVRNSDPDILIIHDMALALGATVAGKAAWKGGDVAVYSFSIGKHISTLEGGIAVTDNEDLFQKLRDYRDRYFTPAGSMKIAKRFAFLVACLAGFHKRSYGLVLTLAERTSLIDSLTRYYSEGAICLPKDFQQAFTGVQARIGLAQLAKLPEIVRRRCEMAGRYTELLQHLKGIVLPPIAEGASYSHYVIRVGDRAGFIANMRKEGVNVGKELFDYSVPHMKVYQEYRDGEFERSMLCSKEVANLPLYPGLGYQDQERIASRVATSMAA